VSAGIQEKPEVCMSHSPPVFETDLTLLERLKQMPSPASRLIGFEVSEAADGRAVVTLQAGPQHANPMGTMHGILCDIADAAMGIAFVTTLAAGESFTTLELKINFCGQCGTNCFARKAAWCNEGARLATRSAKSRTKTES